MCVAARDLPRSLPRELIVLFQTIVGLEGPLCGEEKKVHKDNKCTYISLVIGAL